MFRRNTFTELKWWNILLMDRTQQLQFISSESNHHECNNCSNGHLYSNGNQCSKLLKYSNDDCNCECSACGDGIQQYTYMRRWNSFFEFERWKFLLMDRAKCIQFVSAKSKYYQCNDC